MFQLRNYAKTILVLCFAVMILIVMPGIAMAQSQADAPRLFEAISEVDARIADSPKFADTVEPGVVIRERTVQLNSSVLSNQVMDRSLDAKPGPINIPLFDDISINVVTEELDTLETGLTNWIGHTEKSDFTNFIFIVDDNKLTGNVTVGNRFFSIRPSEDGLHNIAEIDRNAFPEELDSEEPQFDASDTLDLESNSNIEMDETPIIDVMVLYTDDARQGSSDIDAEIALAMLETNVSFRNSGINTRINLVHSTQVDYTESGNLRTDRNRLQNPSDGFMDNIHNLRDQYNADLVGLLVESGGGCGIAYIMNPVSVAFENFGFAVTKRDCATGNFSFGHEFGHILSARHDRLADPTDNRPFAFNHGFVSVPNRWRTVMAYNNQCRNSGVNCTRIQFWSNPDVTRDGTIMGVPIGNPQAADNRAAINITAATVSMFRNPSVGSFNITNGDISNFASWATRNNVRSLTGDFNNDGRTDVALLRQDSGWSTMPVAFANGDGNWRITNHGIGSFASWATASGVLPLTGDFNDDGRTDVALLRQNGGWATMPIAFANGDGTWRITNESIGSFAGWATASGVLPLTGDFNNDGRTDVALLRQNSGWATMPVAFANGDGTWRITNESIGSFAGWATASRVLPLTGDVNGDGLTDVALLRQNSGWATMPIAFANGDGTWRITNENIGSFAGWATLSNVHALTGDFNGDGRTDVALLRQNNGWATMPVAFANSDGTWRIVNNTIGSFAGWATTSGVLPLTGDFNNDGRTDVALLRQDSGWATMPVAFANNDGTWRITNETIGNFANWATVSDVLPFAGDFNNDGRTDVTLLRQNSGWSTMPVAFAQ